MDQAAAALPLGWHLLTRLGEAQILLPAQGAAALWLGWRANAGALALRWLGWTAAAALLTTATKVGFIGYGLGSAALDFTGVSGHAMFAAAIWPPLLALTTAGTLALAGRRAALAAGVALALAVAVSRVLLGAHSLSEVVTGSLLGGAAAALSLRPGGLPPRALPWLAPLLLALAMGTAVAAAPPSRSHDAVTRLALAISGRPQPYTRHLLLRGARPPRPASLQPP